NDRSTLTPQRSLQQRKQGSIIVETPQFKPPKKLIIWLSVIVLLLITLFSTFSYFNGLQKGAVQREVRLSRQYESLKSGLDAFLIPIRLRCDKIKENSSKEGNEDHRWV